MCHDVVHQRQAGVAEREKLSDGNLKEPGEDLPQLRQTGQPAVVARVGPVGGPVVVIRRKRDQIELLRRRLASGQVEREPASRSAAYSALSRVALMPARYEKSRDTPRVLLQEGAVAGDRPADHEGIDLACSLVRSR